MKVLIIGGGGREHAIAVSMKKSKRVDRLYCVPGNAGIAQIAECDASVGAMDFDRIVSYAREKEVDLVFVAPDDPLAAGLVDVLEAEGFRVFGPRKNAAILEGSKAFSKDLMKKYRIPTADYMTFDDPEKALAYLESARMPVVLKADGLALGKQGSVRVGLCGRKDGQAHDFRPGPQAGRRRGPGTQYGRYGLLFPQSLLYGGD